MTCKQGIVGRNIVMTRWALTEHTHTRTGADPECCRESHFGSPGSPCPKRFGELLGEKFVSLFPWSGGSAICGPPCLRPTRGRAELELQVVFTWSRKVYLRVGGGWGGGGFKGSVILDQVLRPHHVQTMIRSENDCHATCGVKLPL